MSTPMKMKCCRGYIQHDPDCKNVKQRDKKTYADACLERAEKADTSPWSVANIHQGYCSIRVPDGYAVVIDVIKDDAEFIAHAREDVPELARRLQRACDILRLLGPSYDHDIPRWIDELEKPLGEK